MSFAFGEELALSPFVVPGDLSSLPGCRAAPRESQGRGCSASKLQLLAEFDYPLPFFPPHNTEIFLTFPQNFS